MAAEETRTIVRQLMERLDQRDLDSVLSYCTADARFYGFAPVQLDRAGYKEMMSALLAAYPDAHFPVDELIVEGEKAVVRHSMRGTHRGTFQGIPPTGKAVTVSAIVQFRLVGNKVAETWLNADFLGMLQQLGVVPAAGQ